MDANSLAGAGFSSTKCRDVTLSNCDFSRVARACDLGQASELSNLTIIGCSFRDSIVWPVYLPAGMGSVPSSAIALSESTFSVDQHFNSAAWVGYGENPFSETIAVASGEVVALAAVATASPAATFQWAKNGAVVAGATNVALDLGAVTTVDSGIYRVEATNAAGSATSNTVVLTVGSGPSAPNPVNVAPVFTTQPVAQTVNAGASVTLSGAASGTPAPSYQWKKGAAAVAGATNASLQLNNVTTGNSGSYTLVATNLAGSATSNRVMLTVGAGPSGPSAPNPVNVAPVITQQPVGQTVSTGSSVTLSAAASGTPAPTITWYRNGVSHGPSWIGQTLSLDSLSSNDAGSYVAVASNSAGTVSSNPAIVTVGAGPSGPTAPKPVNVAPVITQQPVGQTVNTRSSVTLSAAASGTPTPTITWYRNGVTYGPSWTGPVLALGEVTSNDTGSYVAVASNSAGTVTSDPAIVTVRRSPSGPSAAPAISELPPITVLSKLSMEEPTATVDFTVEGPAPKLILIRAIGPTLDALAVSNFLPEAVLTLFQGETLLGHNEAWSGNAEIATAVLQLGMFPFASAASKDAALLVTLNSGSYRVVASGGGGSTGMVLIEISEAP
ncbi:MAG: immunoglobulin domain-containing protein [Opitutaceae bacterium]